MRVLILGGDGFCGWPTSLHLSRRGHDVVIVDNFARRNADIGARGIVADPDRPAGHAAGGVARAEWPRDRLRAARTWPGLPPAAGPALEWRPDAVVHFAEQRAAPYSMKSSWHKRYTVDNNLNATNNLLAAIVEAGVDAHVVHLGTMGVYGYGPPA